MSDQTAQSITHVETLSLVEGDLPRFIGKSGSGIKQNIIKPSWRLFNHFSKKSRASGQESDEKLRVLASFDDGKFQVRIECQSDPMLKFAQKSLGDYVQTFKTKPSSSSPFHYIHFYTSEDHHRIAKFIGRGGQNIKALTSSLSEMLSDTELQRNQFSVSVKPFHTDNEDSLSYLDGKKYAFVNEDRSVSDSVITEDGPYIFIVIKVLKTLTDKIEPEIYSLFQPLVVDYLKEDESYNPEIEAEIEAALGAGW